MEISDPARKNRNFWDSVSDEYQRDHASQLSGGEPVWGLWNIKESELNVLGDVAGKDILEYGCGAAQWSIKLTLLGASMTGLDNSSRQLDHARELMSAAGLRFPLVHSSAESTPLPDASFDIVFCDHGAMSFADPYRTVPEAARLLRPGGLLAFNMTSPIHTITQSIEQEKQTETLLVDYFGMHSFDWPDESVEYQLAYGDWIRLFRANDFAIEDLIELRPPVDAASTYQTSALDWARRWPAENIWKVRKQT